ncbi:putative phage abortive infection protein [Variovorax sp. KBS0712]|uniref:putative phage abortive infection protein n=1 Tax=Variovorax sp. KBS0712 TaxID=2578111 RepID=UPI00163DD1C6|nr:putative phage abortive infection protein [Variovorax sp. KBS0712]
MASGRRGNSTPQWWYAMPFVAVLVAWCLCWWALRGDTDRGTFGDMFGSVNALFSGFAFAGLIVAIRLQSEELALQRQELADTRTVLDGQKTQMEAQADTLKLQQFEATFFQLLRTHGEIVSAIDLAAPGGRVTQGRDCFKVFYSRFRTKAASVPSNTPDMERFSKSYDEFYKEHEHEIGHYFRHLYHIIKFVDSSNVAAPRRYTSFVRAQISTFESLLLFYNCLSSHGVLNFKPLVEKYGLLKHLPRDDLSRDLIKSFKPSAYLPQAPNVVDLVAIGARNLNEY